MIELDKIRQKNYFNDDMALFISVYNRPQYYSRVVESINLCEELTDVPIFIYQDNGIRATIQENLEISKNIKHKNKFFIKRDKNYGCERNILYGYKDMFEKYQFNKMFIIEDDLIVCKNYFKYVYETYNKIKKDDTNTGIFQGWNKCSLNVFQKKQNLNNIIKNIDVHLWGFIWEKDTFTKITPYLNEYLDIFSAQPYNTESNHYRDLHLRKSIIELYKSMIQSSNIENMPEYIKNSFIFNKNPGLTQDCLIDLAFAVTNTNRYCPVVNRSVCIGKNGQHSYDGLWTDLGLDQVQLSEELWS